MTVVAMVPLDQVREPGTKPALEKWSRLGYRSPEEIRASGRFRRRCGVAILTGPSGLVDYDVDGAAGLMSWARLRKGQKLPRTWTLQTSRGKHRFFRDGGVAYKTQAGEIADGIDVRGRGGLAVIYDPTQPERHPLNVVEPVMVPGWLAARTPLAGSRGGNGNGNGNDPPLGELARKGIPPGKHDDTMTRMAVKYAASGDGWTRGEWLLHARGVLARSGEGADANGKPRERFSDERILGWWDSAIAYLEREAGEKTGGKVNGSYPLNDVGNALRLQDMYGEDLRYVPEINVWLTWDSRVWVDDAAKANACAVAVSDALRKQARKEKDEKAKARLLSFATASGNDSKITAMLRQAAALPEMNLSERRFNADPRLLPVRNGTLVLDGKDGKVGFRDHSREDYCRALAPTDYDPEAESELWDDFLDMYVPDLKVRDYLQRLAGYTLLGANQDRRLIFLIGPSSTGKMTFLKLLNVTLGPDNAGPFHLSLFRDRGQDAPRPDMLRAFGRRMIHTTEASAEWRLHADTIKRVTGGDQLTARGMFSNKFVERTASFTPWVATNAYPRIEHADPALWRRLTTVPFKQVVAKATDDPGFTLNFPADERPAILRWLADGYVKYAKNGLDDVPEPVREATEQLRVSLTPIDRWIADRCEVDSAFKYPANDLFHNYQGWCDEEAVPDKERYTQTAFGRLLTDRGYWTPDRPERVGKRSENRKARLRHGLRIRHEN